MNVRPLPKRWLIHEMDYYPPAEKDSWGNIIESDPIRIKHVRYDNSTVFSRDSTQTKIVADGVIFVDAKHSSPIPEFKEDTKVKINGRELTIKKIIPCYHPTKNEVRHYELEVV